MLLESFREVHLTKLEDEIITFGRLVSLNLIASKPTEVPNHAILISKSVYHDPFFGEQGVLGSRVLFQGKLVMLDTMVSSPD